MERGFKSRCENMARALRRELAREPAAPLPPQELAEYLNVRLLTLDDIPDLDPSVIHQLLVTDPGSWSAITVSASGLEAIITNSQHRGGRPSPDIMHELAHLLLGHDPSTMFYVAEEDIALRGYSGEAEAEANWLAGALLLPRDALVRVRILGMGDCEIRDTYGVSQALLRYRLDMTGVNRQYGGRRRPRSQ